MSACQDAHASPLGRQRQRQVGRRGALAHATLARGHGNDVLDARQQLHASLHCVGNDLAAQFDADLADARHGARCSHQGAAQAFDLAGGRIAELDLESDLVARDAQILQLAGGNEILAGIGVDDGLQGFAAGWLR